MKTKRLLSAFALTALFMTLCASASAVTFTFANGGVTASDSAASGYKIDGTALTIQDPGNYIVTGSCTDGSITVKKETTGVALTLQDLTLASATTAPLSCNKASETALTVSGTVTLTDKESLANEDSSGFEGAAIKVKSGASLVIKGDGTLTADGASCKNGIKGASAAAVTVQDKVKLIVKAANNGLASDGSVFIDGGTVTVTADGDGIKSEPEADDTDSAGTVTINAGTVTITAGDDGVQAANGVTVSGGTLDITSVGDGIASDGDITVTDGAITINATGAGGDGIQTAANLTISGGTFDITTFGGYTKVNALGDNSAKGLKASSDVDEPTNKITISGGVFTLNTADDAIHSDCDVTITGGRFTIYTGDDGAHADSVLTLGESGGKDPALQLTVLSSYEGLEGTTVNILSGCYDVTTSDDGINAAGGASSGTDPGGPGGQARPGGPGGDRWRFSAARLQGNAETVNYDNPRDGGRGGFPNGGRFPQDVSLSGGRSPQDVSTNGGRSPQDVSTNGGRFPQDGGRAQLLAGETASINISGGIVKVNANGDGLDANGNLNLTGGNIVVWGQQAGYDNEPLDCDGTLTVNGATVFAAGGRGMGVANPSAGSQNYVAYQGSNIAAGKIIRVKDAQSATVLSMEAVKLVNYVFFSSPSTESGWSIGAGTGTAKADCEITGHVWDAGRETAEAACVTSGTMLYACAVCGETESVTIPAKGHHYVSGRCTECGAADPNASSVPDAETSGYAVTFRTSHASVTVYKTQAVGEDTLDSAAVYYARSGETGNIITSGSGQCNFVVTVADGYALKSVTASPTGNYGSVVTVDAESGLYRVTKISGDVTVTVTAEALVSKAGFSYTLDGTSGTVKLGYEGAESVEANGEYAVWLAWYDADGRFLQFYSESVTLDGDKCAEVTTEFPETFGSLCAFLLDAESKPQTKVVEVAAAQT